MRYEFAPFVFFADTMSLRRNGYSVRLSEQTARVLSEFVKRPGELITRKQLCEVLWPEGEFTDSQQGLNNIISKLRTTLRDDPLKPKYIETIPKRGYQFLARVDRLENAAEEMEMEVAVLEVSGSDPIDGHGEQSVTPDTLESMQAEPVLPRDAGALPGENGTQESAGKTTYRRWVVLAVLLCLVAAIAVALWKRNSLHKPNEAVSVSLAVAPFDLEAGQPGQQQLAESFRLDLIDGLSALPGIHVRAAHSAAGGKPDPAGHPAAQTPAVNAILYTRMTETGAVYSLHVELVRPTDSTHLQSWHYSGTMAQLGSIREQIEADVFSYWRGSAARRLGEVGGTQDPVAYELFLKARFHTDQRSPGALMEAQKEYQAAIDRDPKFAKAYSGLALAKFISSDTRPEQDAAELLATQAVALAPDLADGHAVLGNLYFIYDWRFQDGERELRRAIALDPSDTSYRVWLAQLLGNLGRFDEAFAQIDIAKGDDPYWAPIYQNEVVFGMDAHDASRMTQASDMLLKIKPDSPSSYDTRAQVDWTLGHYAKAIADWRQYASMKGYEKRVTLEDQGLEEFKKNGARAYARLRLDDVQNNSVNDHTEDAFLAAEWYAYAGDQEGCLKELTRMVDARDENVIDLLVNPAYASLHQDVRFQRLIQKMGLPHA